MSNNILTAFNDHFIEFVSDIQNVFPNDPDILATKNILSAVRKANPKMIVKIWNAYVVGKYKSEIEAGNIDFFINKDLTNEYVDSIISNLYNMDVEFKEQFNSFNDDFNLVNKLINTLEEKENYYISKLDFLTNKSTQEFENLSDQIHPTDLIEHIDTANLESDILHPELQNINDKLDIIIEFQSQIYKMNSGYIDVDLDKLTHMLENVEHLN